jgi:phosphoribosylanthranilate isomerase
MRTGLRVGLIIVESSRPVSEKKYQRIFQKEKKNEVRTVCVCGTSVDR